MPVCWPDGEHNIVQTPVDQLITVVNSRYETEAGGNRLYLWESPNPMEHVR